ncbi:hypothetical protein LTR60_006516, partial [Cryomyces antarcticus]
SNDYYESGRPQQGGYYGERRGEERRYEERREDERERRHGGGHGMAYAGMGAAAGLAGGALLMHESGRIEGDYDREKYRLENRVENGIEDVEEFPENAARWTGRKIADTHVQEVEDIPQDIEQDYDRVKYGVENRFDNVVQDVEDVPDDVAGWAGRRVGDVERFDDNIDNAYDEGRYEGRNDDGW